MAYIPIEHTNPAFTEMVDELEQLLVQMFTLSATNLATTRTALANGDTDLAKQVIVQDKQINEIEEQVTFSVATTLARHQPVHHDLHALMGAVKISQELERINDHAKNICRRLPYLLKASTQEFKAELLELGTVIQAMLDEFIHAKQADDEPRVLEVHTMDKQANAQYRTIVEQALTGAGSKEPRDLVNSLFIAKDFERIGDRIKNLAELSHYQRTGENIDFDDDDDDVDAIVTNEAV